MQTKIFMKEKWIFPEEKNHFFFSGGKKTEILQHVFVCVF